MNTRFKELPEIISQVNVWDSKVSKMFSLPQVLHNATCLETGDHLGVQR